MQSLSLRLYYTELIIIQEKKAIISCIFSNRILCCAVGMVTKSATFFKNYSFLLENIGMFFLLSLLPSQLWVMSGAVQKGVFLPNFFP